MVLLATLMIITIKTNTSMNFKETSMVYRKKVTTTTSEGENQLANLTNHKASQILDIHLKEATLERTIHRNYMIALVDFMTE